MKKRLQMQGVKAPQKPKRRREYFNHGFRHTLKKQLRNEFSSRIDYEIMFGEGSWEHDHL